MTMGERITYLRNRKGWSQAELARQARIGQSTLHGYESGTRAARGMSVEVAMRLARALSVTIDYLAGVYEEEDVSELQPAPSATQPRENAHETQPTKRSRSRKAAPVV